MSDWEKPEGLGALLDDARGEGPSPERLERVQGRLEASLGVSLGTAAGHAPSAPPPSAAPPSSSSALVGGLAVAGTLAVALWLLAGREPPAEPAPSPPVETATDDTTRSPSPSADTLEPAPIPPPAAASAPSTPVEPEAPGPPVPAERAPREVASPRLPRDEASGAEDPSSLDPGSTLREEIALLERAMAARDAGDREGARAALGLHRARFPAGILSPERERLLGELSVAPIAPGSATPDPAASP